MYSTSELETTTIFIPFEVITTVVLSSNPIRGTLLYGRIG